MTCKPDGGFQAWLIVAASFIISSIQVKKVIMFDKRYIFFV